MSDFVVEILDDPEAEAVVGIDPYSVEILVKEVSTTVTSEGGVYVEVFQSGNADVVPIILGGNSDVLFTVDEAYEGLTVHFGPGPLPDPEEMPNTVYIILPS
jgi:hypothetical protein